MQTIFLVGYMGCGKSTLGRKLAQRLNVPFFDTDTMVEQVEGASVSDIFHYQGEEYFRQAERAAVERIIAQGVPCVVSTGGGFPIWCDNMELLNSAGYTIYLHRSAEQIARRISPYGRRKRPRLRGLSDEELVPFMGRDIAEREPFYRKSRCTVDCDSLRDGVLIDVVLHELNDGEQ